MRNRIVMASMTRGRARNPDLAPTGLHVEYYRQRASAGLIVTEATWVSPSGIGFINVPGLFTHRQIEGWRAVTDAVHEAGGVIFAQLVHAGAVSHPDFFNGRAPQAPSAVNPGLSCFTPGGFKETVTPRAMTLYEIKQTVEEFSVAARNARTAGFDGVELHAATTYLLPEFLNSSTNLRRDEYGGSPENRARFILEVMDALVDEWGAGRAGIKISPTLSMGNFKPAPDTVATYDYLVSRLDAFPLSHVQVVRASNDLSRTHLSPLQDTIAHYRARVKHSLIANLGYDKVTATELIRHEGADLVSFAKLFISNPDLVHRLSENLPLSPSELETYYEGEARGYTDYSAAS